MSPRRLLFVLFLSMSMTSAFSQYRDTNALTLEYGLSYLARQDLTVSPMVHQDFSALYLGGAYRRNARFSQVARMDFSRFYPINGEVFTFYNAVDQDPEQSEPHRFNFVEVDYAFMWRLPQGEKHEVRVGPQFNSDVDAMNLHYGHTGLFGYFGAFSIGPRAEYVYSPTPEHTLSTGAYFPLMAWTVRSPYLLNDGPHIENTSSHDAVRTFFAYLGDGSLQTLDKFQKLNFYLGYEYKLHEHVHAGVEYEFRFVHESVSRLLLSYQNTLKFHVSFTF